MARGSRIRGYELAIVFLYGTLLKVQKMAEMKRKIESKSKKNMSRKSKQKNKKAGETN
jgi:hypothetical protein